MLKLGNSQELLASGKFLWCGWEIKSVGQISWDCACWDKGRGRDFIVTLAESLAELGTELDLKLGAG